MPEFIKDFESLIRNRIAESMEAKTALLEDVSTLESIGKAAGVIIEALGKGNRVYIAGNGGSAADAQHFAAELVGRFQLERPGLPALALTTDSSALTAISNDYGFDMVFSRQLEALAVRGDVFIGFTTSGNSPNILQAFSTAGAREVTTVAMTGSGGGSSASSADILVAVPHPLTARVQECHILIIHILCELVENALFPEIDKNE